MEACIYEDSPLADYLEGEGEAQDDWAPQVVDWQQPEPTDYTTTNFAPQGPTRFQDRIRNKIPQPLRLKHSNKIETLAKVYDACATAVRVKIKKNDNARFLEQFGYIIVASQLLNEQPSAPSYSSISGFLADNSQNEIPTNSTAAVFGIRGAIFTVFASFSVVQLLHSARSIQKSEWDIRRAFLFVFLLTAVAVAFYMFAKRQWLRYLRRQAVDVASVFVGNAQTLDSAASAAVVLIQEVELVSRGYRVSSPMPPVSRWDEKAQNRRCLKLRRILSQCLAEMLEQYIDAKRRLRPLVDDVNLEKYHDVYDFSPVELQETELPTADNQTDDKTSLRSLRLLFAQVYDVRKSMLCCLLALPADGGETDVTRWGVAIEEMRRLSTTTTTCIQKITNILNEQDRDIIVSSPRSKASPSKDRHRVQLRRLNSLSQGIRGLHAKMNLIREESDACLERSNNNLDLSSTLITQYESIGADLRGLLQEWEAGKSSIVANLENPDRLTISRPTSLLKPPISPTSTSSLGGVTAVDGSPAAALRALNGDESSHSNPDSNLEDDEVFEAVALPRKRVSMTRDERISRMREDRAKQAAIREKSDANTHMLKELETVIKLRPRPKTGPRVTSV